MLKRNVRLPRKEFSFRGGTAARTPYFSLRARTTAAGPPRIGVVVGKVVAKSAAKRNFLKRQIKSALAALAKPGMDYLIIANRAIEAATRREIRSEIAKAVSKIGPRI